MMTVSAAEIAILKCIFSYHAAYLALAEQYGVSCNKDYHMSEMCRSHRYIFLTSYCDSKVTEDIICEIKNYIDKNSKTEFYEYMQTECDKDGIKCELSYTITPDDTCSGDLDINILI